MTISERIKYVRMNQPGGKMSRAAFGEKMGMSGSIVQNIEEADVRLKGGVPDSTVRLICATYHVNYLWLTEGEGPMMEEEDTDAMVDRCMQGETEWAKSIMKAFCRLPDEEWVKFRDLIEEIKKRGRS